MRDIAFLASGKIEKFPKSKIGSDKQPYPCQPLFLLMVIIGYQKRHKFFKTVIGDGQAAIHIGLTIGNHDAKTTDMRKYLQYVKSSVGWRETTHLAV